MCFRGEGKGVWVNKPAVRKDVCCFWEAGLKRTPILARALRPGVRCYGMKEGGGGGR